MKTIILLISVAMVLSKTKHHSHSHSHRLRSKEQQDTVDLFAYDKSGKLIKNSIKTKDQFIPATDSCNFATTVEYSFCLALQDCNLCIRAPRCGWCDSDKKCIPTACNRECPTIMNHPSMKYICGKDNTKIYAGTFDNIKEEAKELISPEITRPKVAITTSKQILGQVNYQKQIGQHTLEEKMSLKNFAGIDNYDSHKVFTSPQLANTSISFPIKEYWNREYYDMITGDSLAHEKVLHGSKDKDTKKKRKLLRK